MTLLPNKIQLASDVLFQPLENEAVLLSLQNEVYYSLNGVGSRAWELMEEKEGDVTAVLAQLIAEYDVDEATLRQDVAKLIADLQEINLLTIVDK